MGKEGLPVIQSVSVTKSNNSANLFLVNAKRSVCKFKPSNNVSDNISDDVVVNAVTCETPSRELMVLEIRINAEKWLLVNMYKQPKVKNNCLTNVLVTLLDQVMDETNNVILFGDLNVNLLEPNNCLSEVFHLTGVQNLVSSPTCDKGETQTLIDLVIMNVPKRIQNVICIDSELSDFHFMILYSKDTF